MAGLGAAFLLGRMTSALPIIPEVPPGFVETTQASEHIVQPGDTLIGIARAQLGEGARWREVQELNKLSTTTLRVGQRILLPAR